MTRKECLEQAMRIVEEMKGYESLVQVYQDAVIQASKGKGRERHASEGEAYEDQIICEVARRVGLGYPLGQAVKKIYESQRIGGDRGVAELLGALNYVAAAVIVMREGLETAPKAEGGCRQNGNDQPEEPEFKPGDAVEWNSIGKSWCPAVYEREFGDFGHCVVRLSDGRERIVSKVDLRKAEANYPENPDSSTAADPGFKSGDRAQAFNGEEWVDCRYIRWNEPEGRHVVQYKGCRCSIDPESLRPVPKAEGCEELVFDEARMRESMPGIVPQDGPSDFDAPQTKEELYQRIMDCNPATFKPHKPTGEELAEMAEEEEEKHG